MYSGTLASERAISSRSSCARTLVLLPTSSILKSCAMPEQRTLPVDQIDEPEVTPRNVYEDAGIIELAESIREVGLLQPIGVVAAGDRFRRVFGKRRLLACRWLGRTLVEVVVLSVDEASEYAAATAENVARRDMTPVEEAHAVRHMMEQRGKSVREIASALGKSESWVRQRVEVLLWPSDVVACIARGELSVSVARELVCVEDLPTRAHFLRCAIDSGVTAQQMRLWRLDWEARRPLEGTDGGVPAMGVAPPAPSAPLWPCAMCEHHFALTELSFVRICVPCHGELDRAKRE